MPVPVSATTISSASSRARVVTVTSVARFRGRGLDKDDPHLDGAYRPWRAYAQAKQANYHFGLGLQQQFETAGVNAQSLIAHPGLTNTDLQSRAVREQENRRLAAHCLVTSDEGADDAVVRIV